MSNRRRLRLAAMISGSGRTLMNICDWIDQGSLNASVELVISSRASAPGLHKAIQRGLNGRVALQRDFDSEASLHDAIISWWREHEVDIVCLCGYLRRVRVDPPWHDRIINIHPALLPRFGGPGMHGEAVHRAVLASGDRISGCTVHFVDADYDHGPVILQRTCPVLPEDDAASLANRVFEQECLAYPQAISLFADGRISLRGDRVVIAPTAGAPEPKIL